MQSEAEIESFLAAIDFSCDPQLLEFIIRLQKLQNSAEFCFQELKELIDEGKAKQIAEFIAKPNATLFSKAINSVIVGEGRKSERVRDSRSKEGRSRYDRQYDTRSRENSSRSSDLRNLISKKPSRPRLSEKAVVRQITQDVEMKKPAPAVDLSKPQVLCKFVREGCLNLHCQFYHPPGKEPKNILKNLAPDTATAAIPSTTAVTATSTIPPAKAASVIICRFDPNCTRYGCYYKHPSKTSVNKVCVNPQATTAQRLFAVDQSEMMID
jgi:hypothetical protein